MRSRDPQTEMAAANPFDRERAASLPLSPAEDELLDAILAEPAPARPPARQPFAWTRGRRPRRLALGVAAIASCLLAFLLVFGSDGGRPTAQPSSAYASEVVRYADASPRLLITGPGWRVDGLQTGVESVMQFVHGDGPKPEETELSWTPTSVASLESRVRRIANELDTQPLTTVPVLGTTATVIQYHEWSPEDLGLFALWQEGDYVVWYSARASMEAFKTQLASLQKVDTGAWLAAMPPSVVQPNEFDPTVQQMLRGVTVPPGFTAADVGTSSIPTDRYQLGASVAGSVSCSWFARWAEARRNGNEDEVRSAVAAMATAKDWPVIRQMSSEGAYGQVLDQLAAAMPQGSVYKDRPLETDVESALCCRQLGIPIPGSGSEQALRAHCSA
jgi:hypothetical protein